MRSLLLAVVVAAGVVLQVANGRAEQALDRPALPFTLRAAVAEALRNSPRLQSAADGVALAEIQRRLAASEFGVRLLPSFSSGSQPQGIAERSVGVTVSKRLSTGTGLALTANSFEYGAGGAELRDGGFTLALSQPLLRGFGSSARASLTSAQHSVSRAERELADARQQLVVSVAAAYFAVLRRQRSIARSRLTPTSPRRPSRVCCPGPCASRRTKMPGWVSGPSSSGLSPRR
ncbi:MAG: TolC family protein [Acidobacteria bacterium]|nr:TolC family protein [Acidobacteriota bacterium]